MNKLGTLIKYDGNVYKCIKTSPGETFRCNNCDLTNKGCNEVFNEVFGTDRDSCKSGFKYELVVTEREVGKSISDEIEPIISKLEYLKFRVDEIQKESKKIVKKEIDELKENNYYFENEEEIKQYIASNKDLMDDIVRDNYIEKIGTFIVYENMNQIMNDDNTVKAILDEVFNRSR